MASKSASGVGLGHSSEMPNQMTMEIISVGREDTSHLVLVCSNHIQMVSIKDLMLNKWELKVELYPLIKCGPNYHLRKKKKGLCSFVRLIYGTRNLKNTYFQLLDSTALGPTRLQCAARSIGKKLELTGCVFL